jgi:nucleolysin TIA-1/TIAR
MADNAASAGNLPPPPPPAGAPGYDGANQGYDGANQGYDGANQGYDQANQANQQQQPQQQQQQHMPPPSLAPVIIPQNTNPIPTAISSPMSGGVMSPTSGGPGYAARRAAPEPNKRALYVGGLDPRVTEDVLRQIFETTGHVQSVKIIPDKTASSPSVRPAPESSPSDVTFFFQWSSLFFHATTG